MDADEPVQRDDAKSDASSSSSDGSDNESEMDFENEEKAIQGVIGKWDPGTSELEGENVQFARHKVSRCIHVMHDETGISFKCGRRMATTYLVLDEKPTFMHPLCNTCFRPEGQ